jgi:hypothetical protein
VRRFDPHVIELHQHRQCQDRRPRGSEPRAARRPAGVAARTRRPCTPRWASTGPCTPTPSRPAAVRIAHVSLCNPTAHRAAAMLMDPGAPSLARFLPLLTHKGRLSAPERHDRWTFSISP